jgi:hypothetical protein
MIKFITVGRIIAKNITGKKAIYDFVPYFWSMQFGKSLRYCGHVRSLTLIHLGNRIHGYHNSRGSERIIFCWLLCQG